MVFPPREFHQPFELSRIRNFTPLVHFIFSFVLSRTFTSSRLENRYIQLCNDANMLSMICDLSWHTEKERKRKGEIERRGESFMHFRALIYIRIIAITRNAGHETTTLSFLSRLLPFGSYTFSQFYLSVDATLKHYIY